MKKYTYICLIALIIFVSTFVYSTTKHEDNTETNIEQLTIENSTSENDNVVSTDETMLAFEAMLENWEAYAEVCEVMSNCESSEYAYYDIDNDEIMELIILNVKGLAIFKYQNGQILRVNWSPYSVLLENGMIKYYRPGGAPDNEKYIFFEFDGISYNSVESFERYDANEDGVYDETDLYLHDGEEVKMQNWESLFEKYSEYGEAVLTYQGVLVNSEANSEQAILDDEFCYVEGDWIVTEYIDCAVESHELYDESEEYIKEYEERTEELVEEYLGATININFENVENIHPMTELGYDISDDDMLFMCVRQPASLDIKAPYTGICVYINGNVEPYKYIIDADGEAIVMIKNVFFRVEKEDALEQSYINEYVTLTDGTEVEDYEWIDERCLRVKVQYIEKPENEYQHKEDYFFFFNEASELTQVLNVKYDDKIIGAACDFEAHFEDVSFDGNPDLLIYIGDNKYEHYCAYIYEEDLYTYEQTFEEISQYKIDYEEKVIYGWNGDAANLETNSVYEYVDGEFVLIAKDTHDR